MMLRGRLLDFLANLPGTDSPESRKALVEFTGFQSLCIYLDWQGSNMEFFERMLAKLGAEGQESLVAFLETLVRRPEWIGVDRQPTLTQLREEVAALTATAWQEQFPLESDASAAPGVQPPDLDMLATALVLDVLLPYVRTNAERLLTAPRVDLAAEVDGLASAVWRRLQEAFGTPQDGSILQDLVLYPDDTASLLKRKLRQQLAADSHLTRDLADLLRTGWTRQRVVVTGGSRAKDLTQSAPARTHVDQDIQITDHSSVGNVRQQVVD